MWSSRLSHLQLVSMHPSNSISHTPHQLSQFIHPSPTTLSSLSLSSYFGRVWMSATGCHATHVLATTVAPKEPAATHHKTVCSLVLCFLLWLPKPRSADPILVYVFSHNTIYYANRVLFILLAERSPTFGPDAI